MIRNSHLRLVHAGEPSPPVTYSFKTTRRVLAVLNPYEPLQSVVALSRAREIVRVFDDSELSVLVILPKMSVSAAERATAHLLSSRLSGLRLWSKKTPHERMFIRSGHPTKEASQVAKQIGADMIVVGAASRTGGYWARLARRLNVAVLIARGRPTDAGAWRGGGAVHHRSRRGRWLSAILAATDFTDESFPVLATAKALAESQRHKHRNETLVLHNIEPDGRIFRRHFGFTLAEKSLRQLRDLRAEKLHTFARMSGPEMFAVVSGNVDPVSAIDEHATRHCADLVVVGTHCAPSPPPPRAPVDEVARQRGAHRDDVPHQRAARHRTAERIVERVAMSTMIVPLSPHGSLVA